MGTPLGDFIRAKRDATQPADLGLPDDGRRRAPGLRRTELATRAQISIEYLTRIEQGRDHNPTLPVVNSIADALGLDAIERRHLYYLAKITGGACAGQRRVGSPPQRPDAWPAALEMLRLLEPDGVAMVSNKIGDVLATTGAFDRLMEPTGLLDPDAPNLVRYLFSDPRSRESLGNWDHVADVQAFDLWHAPTFSAAEWLRADLAAEAGPGFTARVDRTLPPLQSPWEIRLPTGATTKWHREVLDIPREPDQQIVMLIPADEATRAAFAPTSRGDVTRLRAVEGTPGEASEVEPRRHRAR